MAECSLGRLWARKHSRAQPSLSSSALRGDQHTLSKRALSDAALMPEPTTEQRERMTVSLVWATPNADQIIGDLARVSAPENQGKDAAKLIASLIRRKEWSPLEMADMCVEIYAEHDVTRQIL